MKIPCAPTLSTLLILVSVAAAQVPGGFPGEPVLHGLQLLPSANSDSLADVSPSLAFSRTQDDGVLVWSKNVPGGCSQDDFLISTWNGSQWSQASLLRQGIASSGPRRLRHGSVDYAPSGTTAMIAMKASPIGQSACWDDLGFLTSPFAPWPFGAIPSLADGQDDDDRMGALRYDQGGGNVVVVWIDDVPNGIAGVADHSLEARAWNAATGTWSPSIPIEPSAPAGLGRPVVEIDRCLEQHLPTGQWVVAYRKQMVDLSSPSSWQIAVRRFSASAAGIGAVSPEEVVSDPNLAAPALTQAVSRPQVDLDGQDRAGVFWTQDFGSGSELVACVSTPTLTFGPSVRLAPSLTGVRLLDIEGGAEGWHLLYALDPAPGIPGDLYHAWFDGFWLSDPVRLTLQGDVAEARFEADRQGRHHLALVTGSGTARDLSIGYLQFPQLRMSIGSLPLTTANQTYPVATGTTVLLEPFAGPVSPLTSGAPLTNNPLSIVVNVGSVGVPAAMTGLFGLLIPNFEAPNGLSIPWTQPFLTGDGLGLANLGFGTAITCGSNPGFPMPCPTTLASPGFTFLIPPAILPSGAELHFQALVLDPSSSPGFPLRATNALRLQAL